MQPDLTHILQQGCEELKLKLNQEQVQQLLDYLRLLQKWNKVYSLTAINNPRQMVIYHLLDGLSAVSYFANYSSVLDVGSGMGVPGIILAISYPQTAVTLIDSNSKKTAFLQQVKIELGLSNLQVICSRIEALPIENRYMAITSRAFADLNLFVELSGKFLADNGSILALKGELAFNEVAQIDDWDNEIIEIQVPFLDAKRFLVKLVRK